MPHLGESYRRTLASLLERLSGDAKDPETMARARRLIAHVVIHRASPRTPPGIGIEGHIAAILATAQPDLPPQAAEAVARACRLSLKEEPGALRPLAEGVRGVGLMRPTRLPRQPRAASTTPPNVNASAVSCRGPIGSPSSRPEDSTPMTGTSRLPIAAVPAGSTRSARNQAR